MGQRTDRTNFENYWPFNSFFLCDVRTSKAAACKLQGQQKQKKTKMYGEKIDATLRAIKTEFDGCLLSLEESES